LVRFINGRGTLAAMTPLNAGIVGAGVGLLATAVMTLFEGVFWRRRGMEMVAEWRVNAVLSNAIRKRKHDPNQPDLKAAIGMHFVHGLLFGFAAAIIAELLGLAGPLVFAWAIGSSLVVWAIVPYATRGFFEEREGAKFSRASLEVSLLAHLIYGTLLGIGLALLAV